MRSEIATDTGPPIPCCAEMTAESADAASVPGRPNEAGGEREGNSWRQLERAVAVLQCHVMIRHRRHISTKCLTETAEQRREGADSHSRTADIEGSIHLLHQFGVLGGWLCCLSVGLFLLLFVFLSLSLSPGSVLRPRQKQKSADVCTNTMTPRSCVFLNQQRQNREEKIMERGRRKISCPKNHKKHSVEHSCSVPKNDVGDSVVPDE